MTRPILTALEAGALRTALVKLLDPSRWFDVCAFDQMCKVYQSQPIGRDYEALRLLHCVPWRDMDVSTRREAHAAIVRTFAADEQDAEGIARSLDDLTEKPEKAAPLWRRLIGGAP